MTALRHELTSKESLVQLGKLAAGAAHEMNNPLAIIRGRSQQLFERTGTERERESARAIAAASDQLSDLITSLHLIADPPKPHMALCDPALMVRRAIEIARERCHTQKLRARVQLKSEGSLGPIPMDIDLLAQGVAEPIINAVQANPGAIVTVCIEPALSNDRISIRINDRGPGFTEQTIKHAFDPFFSALSAGRRSGLGEWCSTPAARSLTDTIRPRCGRSGKLYCRCWSGPANRTDHCCWWNQARVGAGRWLLGWSSWARCWRWSTTPGSGCVSTLATSGQPDTTSLPRAG